MTPLRGLETYRLLLRNQWKTTKRVTKARQSVFIWLVLGAMICYAAFTLLVLGFYFDRFASVAFPGADPLQVVNQFLLAGFLSLFFIRFLFQKTPRMKLTPYLHLPVRKVHLVAFFQASSLLSIHNIYPMLFFIPFWFSYVRPEHQFVAEWLWLASIFGVVASSHFANLILRSLLRRRVALFYPLMVVLILVAVIDETIGYGMTNTLSSYLFNQILAADFLAISLVGGTTLLLAVFSSLLLLKTLREPLAGSSGESTRRREFFAPERFGVTGQLVYLELLLMWRNRRPRHYLILSLMFSTMYLIVMIATEEAYGGVMFDGLIGLFASGGFALNYGQLMFSWDSKHFDGLMSRNVTFRDIVRAKLILLQASCLILFVTSLPLFALFRPDLLTLHMAFLFYNAGVTSILVMELASRNSQAVDVSQTGGFFNYEGFSARHWLWFIPTALPPTLFMVAIKNRPFLGLTILATVGFVSLLASELWTAYFSRGLEARKYAMARGFRKNAH